MSSKNLNFINNICQTRRECNYYVVVCVCVCSGAFAYRAQSWRESQHPARATSEWQARIRAQSARPHHRCLSYVTPCLRVKCSHTYKWAIPKLSKSIFSYSNYKKLRMPKLLKELIDFQTIFFYLTSDHYAKEWI